MLYLNIRISERGRKPFAELCIAIIILFEYKDLREGTETVETELPVPAIVYLNIRISERGRKQCKSGDFFHCHDLNIRISERGRKLGVVEIKHHKALI